MRRIFLRDHDLHASGWQENLCMTFGEVECAIDEICLAKDPIYNSSSEDLLFLHSQQRICDWISKTEQKRIKAQVILVRSHGGNSGYQGTAQNIHQCIWSPDEFVERPEPQQFVSRIGEGFQPVWELLDRVHFPVNLLASCWLLSNTTFAATFEERLSECWQDVINEVVTLTTATKPLIPFNFLLENQAQNHAVIKNILDSSWQSWAPYSPYLVIRRRLSHDWCDKRAMHEDPLKVASEWLEDLRCLIEHIHLAFKPSQYRRFLSDCFLEKLSDNEFDRLCDWCDSVVEEQYNLSSVRAELIARYEMISTLLLKNQPNNTQLTKLVDLLCQSLSKLPKFVPMP